MTPSHPYLFTAMAGIWLGGSLGAWLPTRTERRIRGIRYWSGPPTPDGYLGLLLYIARSAVLAFAWLAFSTAVGLGILRIGGIDGLPPDLRQVLLLGVVFGGGGAKYLRYMYWRWTV